MSHDLGQFWQARYSEREQIWSEKPNHALVMAVTGLPPGRAVDLGCGEGGDSVWLAEQGWVVTAVDIAATAIERGQALAARHDIPSGQISWVVEDLRAWQPDSSFELVTACFFHSPVDFPRTAVLRRAATAVTSGGHLLVVSHAAPPPSAKAHDHGRDAFLRPDEELANLRLEQRAWEVLVSETRLREAIGRDGENEILDDSVILARRR